MDYLLDYILDYPMEVGRCLPSFGLNNVSRRFHSQGGRRAQMAIASDLHIYALFPVSRLLSYCSTSCLHFISLFRLQWEYRTVKFR